MIATVLVSCLVAAPAPATSPTPPPSGSGTVPAPSPVPEPPIELPPAAKQHNARGIALVYAGQDDAGIAELEQAYAAMPDPLRHRAGRGKVLGSLRSALLRRHAATGDRAPLCRLRELLRDHRAALLAALGPSASLDDFTGTDTAIREVDAALGDRPCIAPRPPPAPTVLATVPPSSDPRRPTAARPHRIAGGVLLGFAGLATLGTATAAAIYGDRYRRLDALDRGLGTPAEIAEKERLHHEGRVARTAGVALGIGAGALLVAGVAVLVAAPRARRDLGLAPIFTPTAWGLHLSGRF